MNSFPNAICRVLMTTDTLGEIWTHTLELSRGLAADGVEIILATMGATLQPHQREELAELGDAIDLHESDFRVEWMHDAWTDVAAAGEWLLALERGYQPDLVHLNSYAHAALPFTAPKLVVAHSCIVAWWDAVQHTPPPLERARYQTAVRLGLDQADLIVAPSQTMLIDLAKNHGASGPARIIPPGRDFPSSSDDRWHDQCPPHLAKQPFVLGVGHLCDEANNCGALATVAPALPWPVHLVGDNESWLGEVLPLRNVRLIDHASSAQLAEHYRRASIFVSPARYEPFGFSAHEAASAGCALILGDIPSLRERWEGAALFVPPNDPEALRGTLLALIDDPHLRRALAHLATLRAAQFTGERMVAGYLDAYASLLAAPRSFTGELPSALGVPAFD